MDFLLYIKRLLPMEDLNFIMNVAIIALLWFGGRALIRHLTALTEQVTKTNGRVIKLETWTEGHEKQDDERHAEVLRHLEHV